MGRELKLLPLSLGIAGNWGMKIRNFDGLASEFTLASPESARSDKRTDRQNAGWQQRRPQMRNFLSAIFLSSARTSSARGRLLWVEF
jgi:hypothetical protein